MFGSSGGGGWLADGAFGMSEVGSGQDLGGESWPVSEGLGLYLGIWAVVADVRSAVGLYDTEASEQERNQLLGQAGRRARSQTGCDLSRLAKRPVGLLRGSNRPHMLTNT